MTSSTETRSLLLKELNASKDLYEKIKTRLGDGICLYGCGFVGKWAYRFLKDNGAKINFIIDNNPNMIGGALQGTAIIASEQAYYSDVTSIIIGSRHHASTILKSLTPTNKLLMSIDGFVVHHFWDSHVPMLEAMFEHDDQSLQLLHLILLAMLSGDTRVLCNSISYAPFFSEYKFFNVGSEVFVDAGAYVGDSFERFLWSTNGVFKKAFLFEPGIAQYKALLTRVSRLTTEWALDDSKIVCCNSSVGKNNGKKLFSQSGNLTQLSIYSSDLSVTGQIQEMAEVKMISIDEYFQNQDVEPSLIKVDIEGGEVDLLKGACKTLENIRPKLALSVYHYPSDIFLLPKAIIDLASKYTFKLRHHSSMLMETVLYAY